MDGIDCLIASCFFVFFLTLSNIQTLETLILAGTLLGFLPYNYSPARLFMGDVGSTFIASYTISVLFNNQSIYNSFFILLIIMPLILDAIICILIRIKLKHNIFTAHKYHLYQRIVMYGLSHIKVTSLYLFPVIINCFIYKFFSLNILYLSNILWLFIGLYLNKKYAVPYENLNLK
jgi:UDP-N-acetylmuramyl pentapeptide phosphotransferase/UDP-N-acetylglucosamine-1-phosphate transferase